jgi:hypothetical protein
MVAPVILAAIPRRVVPAWITRLRSTGRNGLYRVYGTSASQPDPQISMWPIRVRAVRVPNRLAKGNSHQGWVEVKIPGYGQTSSNDIRVRRAAQCAAERLCDVAAQLQRGSERLLGWQSAGNGIPHRNSRRRENLLSQRGAHRVAYLSAGLCGFDVNEATRR